MGLAGMVWGHQGNSIDHKIRSLTTVCTATMAMPATIHRAWGRSRTLQVNVNAITLPKPTKNKMNTTTSGVQDWGLVRCRMVASNQKIEGTRKNNIAHAKRSAPLPSGWRAGHCIASTSLQSSHRHNPKAHTRKPSADKNIQGTMTCCMPGVTPPQICSTGGAWLAPNK